MRIQLSSGVIINEKNELLVLFKRNHKHYEFPEGKVEEGESLKEAAKRECREELSVKISVIKYIGSEDIDFDERSFISHKYLAVIKKNEIPKVNEPEEFENIFWMPIIEYKKYSCAPNVKNFCKKYLLEI